MGFPASATRAGRRQENTIAVGGWFASSIGRAPLSAIRGAPRPAVAAVAALITSFEPGRSPARPDLPLLSIRRGVHATSP